MAWDTFSYSLTWGHWAALVLFAVFMLYSEGYRGFQTGFSPRVAARARYLKDHPRLHHVLLAPLFCMGLVHATTRRRIVSMSLVVAIVILVLLVQQLAQPWRGIVDIGVVLGLSWGLVSLVAFTFRAFGPRDLDIPTDVPESNA